jgi:GTP pyrophosphokinase
VLELRVTVRVLHAFEALFEEINRKFEWDDQLGKAFEYAADSPQPDKSRPRSIEVAKRVLDSGSDRDTVIATLLSDPGLRDQLDPARLEKEFGSQIAKLTQGVNQINLLKDGSPARVDSPEQAEKLRRLLMAIISDVRVMLIKLCYRAERLRLLKHGDYETRRQVAQETLDIYAPLANRLGMGLLKWELEDLAFRALEPQVYKRIASLLEEKRSQREAFIDKFTRRLERLLEEQEISAEVIGRAKHIVSIWRKMQRKNLEFHELFDVRAVRILVESVADCYAVLGVVHTTWQHVPREFDDYIANPKDNGYRSLHTAVVAEDGRVVEVQIRTRQMHEESELGVASHWRYKEGARLDQRMEASISRMRDLLQGSDEEVSDAVSEISTELSSDRVYVFTPTGQIVDIPQGGTPLDFAYSIHSEVGHRCRGAKVNGRIVNLTAVLQTGDEVEILTTKEARPSRDWMNKNLGFIKSAGTRAKVRNWFNHQDFEQNLLDGKSIFDRTLSKYSIHDVDIRQLLKHFKRKDSEQFFADIGRGLITAPQILGCLQTDTERDPFRKIRKETRTPESRDEVSVHGVGNLMTQFGRCCNPVPGDEIIGFITVNSGITIHKRGCSNILSLPEEKRQRLIEVEWGGSNASVYPVEISMSAYQRTGLMQDISTILANLKINLLNVDSKTNRDDQMVYTRLTMEIHSVDELVVIMDKLAQLPNVQDVRRVA